jgi:hypothetical protein
MMSPFIRKDDPHDGLVISNRFLHPPDRAPVGFLGVGGRGEGVADLVENPETPERLWFVAKGERRGTQARVFLAFLAFQRLLHGLTLRAVQRSVEE